MNEYRVRTIAAAARPRSERLRNTASAAVLKTAVQESGGDAYNDWFVLKMVEGTEDNPQYYLETKYLLMSLEDVVAGGIAPGGTTGNLVSVAYSGLQDLTSEEMDKVPTAWGAKKLEERIAALESMPSGGVTSISVNGGAAQTGAVALTVPSLVGYATESWVLGKNYITEADHIIYRDTRSDNPAPYSNAFKKGIEYCLKLNSADGLSDGGAYHGVMTLHHWSDDSAGKAWQLGYTDGGIWCRSGITAWSSWTKLALLADIPTNNNQLANGAGYITASALNSYLPLNGGNITGSLTVQNHTVYHAGNFIAETNYQSPISDLATIRSRANDGHSAYESLTLVSRILYSLQGQIDSLASRDFSDIREMLTALKMRFDDMFELKNNKIHTKYPLISSGEITAGIQN